MQKGYEVKRVTGGAPAEDEGRHWSGRFTGQRWQFRGEAWGWVSPSALRRNWSHT